MIYLDTHAVLWLYQMDTDRFSKQVIELIEKNEIFISPIVMLELEYLYEIDRISVHGKEIIEYLISRINLKICDNEFSKVVLIATGLKWTRDPFDRIITAQAMINNNKLITKDGTIQKNYENAVW